MFKSINLLNVAQLKFPPPKSVKFFTEPYQFLGIKYVIDNSIFHVDLFLGYQ